MTNKKKCSKCGELKAPEEFSMRSTAADGKQARCKVCTVTNTRKWRLAHPEKNRVCQRKWRVANPANCREHRVAYREKHNKHMIERRKNDVQFHICGRLRSRTYKAVKNGQKAGSAVRDLGCSIPELKARLEALWQPSMAWENYGRHKGTRCWEIDHIAPLVSFDLTDRKQLLEAVHFTNLQPLWADENKRKGAKLPEDVLEL